MQVTEIRGTDGQAETILVGRLADQAALRAAVRQVCTVPPAKYRCSDPLMPKKMGHDMGRAAHVDPGGSLLC